LLRSLGFDFLRKKIKITIIQKSTAQFFDRSTNVLQQYYNMHCKCFFVEYNDVCLRFKLKNKHW